MNTRGSRSWLAIGILALTVVAVLDALSTGLGLDALAITLGRLVLGILAFGAVTLVFGRLHVSREVTVVVIIVVLALLYLALDPRRIPS